MFEWKQEYAFGLDDIDKQHQRLFEIGHRLEEVCNDPLTPNQYQSIREAVLELDDYTTYHFDYEEEWLSFIGFESTRAHQEEHDQFTAKIAELKSSSNAPDLHSLDLIRETLSFLARWIIHHVLMVDLEYVSAITAYRAKHTPLL